MKTGAAAQVGSLGPKTVNVTVPVGVGAGAAAPVTVAVSAMGKTVSEAQGRAYRAVDKIGWPGGFCRRDIGWQPVKRERDM